MSSSRTRHPNGKTGDRNPRCCFRTSSLVGLWWHGCVDCYGTNQGLVAKAVLIPAASVDSHGFQGGLDNESDQEVENLAAETLCTTGPRLTRRGQQMKHRWVAFYPRVRPPAGSIVSHDSTCSTTQSQLQATRWQRQASDETPCQELARSTFDMGMARSITIRNASSGSMDSLLA